MAAKAFTHSEWKKIRERLEADPARYGLPDRVYGSVLLASFNIRKLGSATRRNNDTWKFLAHVCRRFDLLAVHTNLHHIHPHAVLRELRNKRHPGTEPYQFMAINAHLYFGDYIADRSQEFDALMEWILARVRENDRAYYPNFIFLGDLNLDFDNPRTDRKRIEKHMKTFNTDTEDDVNVNFPFLDPHPNQNKVFRTNARLDETFDQIGLFCRDQRMPSYLENASMGQDPRGPDYGVFDFANLFSEALNNQPLDRLPPEAKGEFLARFEHKVSDHMPLWLRLPLP